LILIIDYIDISFDISPLFHYYISILIFFILFWYYYWWYFID
jgi:hypothetical protein